MTNFVNLSSSMCVSGKKGSIKWVDDDDGDDDGGMTDDDDAQTAKMWEHESS